MRFTTKTEYGLICLMAMIRAGGKGVVMTVADIVKKESYSRTFMEKILQALRKARIVESHPGIHGGYLLARDPSQITFKEVVEGLEGHTFDVFCEPRVRDHIVCTHLALCGVQPIWQRTKELLDQYFGSITLEMIAKNMIPPAAPAASDGAPVKLSPAPK